MHTHALSPILDIKRSQKVLEVFDNIFTAKYTNLLHAKLDFKKEDENDLRRIKRLLDTLEPHNVDYTAFFRLLSRYNGTKTKLLALSTDKKPLLEWLDDYDRRMAKEKVNIEMQDTCYRSKIHLKELYT
jgi:uncharacterized protein YdiU (UPF0061 family)